jgi:tetratricopeptide (TPR) repeat protein
LNNRLERDLIERLRSSFRGLLPARLTRRGGLSRVNGTIFRRLQQSTVCNSRFLRGEGGNRTVRRIENSPPSRLRPERRWFETRTVQVWVNQMILQEIQNKIQVLLTQWIGEIKSETNFGQNDKKTISEIVLAELLREIYGYEHLKTLNANAGFNFPGIDLGDEQARVAIQVTATPSSEKILHTLEQFLKYEQYKNFDRLIVYILTEKQQGYSNKNLLAKVDELSQKRQELNLEQEIFDLKRDVWDSSDLQNAIAAMEVAQATRVLKILESNFEQRNSPRFNSWKRLENPDRRFGGQDNLDALVNAVLEPNPQPVLVQGLAGIGKSNLCQHALDHPAVRDRYSSRRAFVRCDATLNRENLVAQIAAEIGVPPGPNLEVSVLAELEREACVVVLDNLETPWNASTPQVESFLRVLVGVPGVALVAGVRGGSRPDGPHWNPVLQPKPMSLEEARALFLATSGGVTGPGLDGLLHKLDGLPLAIKLIARQAQGAPNLAGLVARYEAKRAALLAVGSNPDRASSLPVSLELSFDNPLMTVLSRTGASVLALLPDGVLHSDVAAVLEDGEQVAQVLRDVGLAFDREGRLRMLAPVREHVSAAHPVMGTALDRIFAFYARLLIQHGNDFGQEGNVQTISRLSPEINNAAAMVLKALEVDKNLSFTLAIPLGQFASAHGFEVHAILFRILKEARGTRAEPQLLCVLASIERLRSDHDEAQKHLKEALLLFQNANDLLGQAHCHFQLANIALARSYHDDALASFEHAMTLAVQINDIPLQAFCISGVSDIFMREAKYKLAKEGLEEALRLLEIKGKLIDKADCTLKLAEIAGRLGEHDDGKKRFSQARSMFESVGSILGEANCIRGMAEIAIHEHDYAESHELFELALGKYKLIRELLGQANCIQGFGRIELERSEFTRAQARFEEALPIARQIGNALCEGACIFGLGEVAMRLSSYDDAREKYVQALAVFGRIPDPYLMGVTHLRLSEIARSDIEREHHLSEARRLWLSINRPDLIATFLDST